MLPTQEMRVDLPQIFKIMKKVFHYYQTPLKKLVTKEKQFLVWTQLLLNSGFQKKKYMIWTSKLPTTTDLNKFLELIQPNYMLIGLENIQLNLLKTHLIKTTGIHTKFCLEKLVNNAKLQEMIFQLPMLKELKKLLKKKPAMPYYLKSTKLDHSLNPLMQYYSAKLMDGVS